MKPRYIIVDKEKRDDFEMKWQIPYGYSTCRIFEDEDEALNQYKKSTVLEPNRFILEKYDMGYKEEIIYEEA